MKPIYLLDQSNGKAVRIPDHFDSFSFTRNGRCFSVEADARTFDLCKIENIERELRDGLTIVKSEAGMTPEEDLPIVLDELLYCTDEGTELEFTYDNFKRVRFKFDSINARKVLVHLLCIVKRNDLFILSLIYQSSFIEDPFNEGF